MHKTSRKGWNDWSQIHNVPNATHPHTKARVRTVLGFVKLHKIGIENAQILSETGEKTLAVKSLSSHLVHDSKPSHDLDL